MSVVGSSVGGSVGGFCSLSGRSLRSCVCCGSLGGWVSGWVFQFIWKEFEIMCLLWVGLWLGFSVYLERV